MARKRSPVNFERSLAELERIVEQLEEGELSLEESLRAYERGVELSRACQQALDGAEQRVQILTEGDGDPEPRPFTADEG